MTTTMSTVHTAQPIAIDHGIFTGMPGSGSGGKSRSMGLPSASSQGSSSRYLENGPSGLRGTMVGIVALHYCFETKFDPRRDHQPLVVVEEAGGDDIHVLVDEVDV